MERRSPSVDHEHHSLRVVAVDHILQAADVAFIDEEELKELTSRFVTIRQRCSRSNHSSAQSAAPCFPVVYVKGVSELKLETFADTFWQESGGVFLVQPDVRDSILRRL